MRKIRGAFGAVLGAFLLAAAALAAAPGADAPVLWLWKRPEDLRFLGPGDATAAVLVGTLLLHPESTRRQQMKPRAIPRKPVGEEDTVLVRLTAAAHDRRHS